jgi:hypothetical protein
MYGWLIVWPCSIGSARSSYATGAGAWGTNASRGIVAIA